MTISGLYCITDTDYQTGLSLVEKASACINAGINVLQYRNKSATEEEQLQQTKKLAPLCRTHNTCFLINDNPRLAKIVGADGVHLGQTDGSLAEARSILGAGATIGVTCHNNIELAIKAEKEGANYIALGRFFPSNTKPDAASASLEIIQQVKARIDIPVVAIGGITMDNLAQVLHAGADAVAIIEGIMGQADPAQAVLALSKLINRNKQ